MDYTQFQLLPNIKVYYVYLQTGWSYFKVGPKPPVSL